MKIKERTFELHESVLVNISKVFAVVGAIVLRGV